MANVVQQINDAMETQIATSVGAGWNKLSYIFNVENNHFRTNNQRYGSRPLSASNVPGVTRQYTVDHIFEIILTTDYVNKQSEDSQKAAVFTLFDKMSDILVDIIKGKIGIPNIVLNIEPFAHLEPEFLEEDNVVVQRTQVTIRYREALT